MENNLEKINWYNLSGNKNAIHILENNLEKINWDNLSRNKKAIHILENNLERINWYEVSGNRYIFDPIYWELAYTKYFIYKKIPIIEYYIILQKILIKDICLHILGFISI